MSKAAEYRRRICCFIMNQTFSKMNREAKWWKYFRNNNYIDLF